MEGFRPLVADSAVLSAVNTRMVTPRDFIPAGRSVSLTPSGRKALLRAYEQRMDNLVTQLPADPRDPGAAARAGCDRRSGAVPGFETR